jgi:hypothetical protein
MIRVDTVSGLHGTLVGYRQTGDNSGEAIVKRDYYPFEDLPYSVHTLYCPDPVNQPGALAAENGRYELTLEQAREILGFGMVPSD